MINLEKLLIDTDIHRRLCSTVFKVLNCNLLWVMKLDNDGLNMLVSDKFILEHYWRKKYYLQDSSLQTFRKKTGQQKSKSKSGWKIALGTECNNFESSGFLYDLYKMFDIKEFVSVEKQTNSGLYCFRFFTRNDRYVFMNRLINNMPIIKRFINVMIEKLELTLYNQPAINIAGLKRI